MRTIVHISDLHFGRIRPDLLAPLGEGIAAARPDLIAVSGDLTQRARVWQFAEARRFLVGLPAPLLVVPGNHDVPLTRPWARLLWPWHRYRHAIGPELEPWHRDDELLVVGLNTVTPFACQRGRIAQPAVLRACALLAEAEGRTRIVVAHHPFAHAPGETGKAPMRGAPPAIRALAACGVDIFLAGHLHNWRAEPYRAPETAGRAVLMVQAGTGLSTRLRGEDNDYNVLRIAPGMVTAERFAADGAASGFRRVEAARFVRTAEGWREAP